MHRLRYMEFKPHSTNHISESSRSKQRAWSKANMTMPQALIYIIVFRCIYYGSGPMLLRVLIGNVLWFVLRIRNLNSVWSSVWRFRKALLLYPSSIYQTWTNLGSGSLGVQLHVRWVPTVYILTERKSLSKNYPNTLITYITPSMK